MEIVTDYEVEGCWSTKKVKSKCRCCGAIEKLVPEKGHYNSKYWELKRNDGLSLYCCPNGCSVDEACRKMNYYLTFNKYMTEDSESYNYKLDYKKIRYFWLDRNGIMYPCEHKEHDDVAREILNSNRGKLENKGFIISIITNEGLMLCCDKKISKQQLDILFDWMIENNFDTKELMEQSEKPYLGIYMKSKNDILDNIII